MNASSLPTVHVCIATGQNAANLIPLLQCQAREVRILETAAMRGSAKELAQAIPSDQCKVRREPFDDSSPAALRAAAEALAARLDGRHVVLHVTGGTKLMVLALREELRLVEAGSGSLDVVYADTRRQQLDWLGPQPRVEPMADVLDLQSLLLVRGYRNHGESRHSAAHQRASQPERAQYTRYLVGLDSRKRGLLRALAGLASRAADGAGKGDLLQTLQYAPGRYDSEVLHKASRAGLLSWDGDVDVEFASIDTARYLAGGWCEEFVLLKLAGMVKPGRFASNLQVVSRESKVPNEVDAMVVHRNRALVIECKTGRQDKASDAIYKLAQVRDRLGGSEASALYLSAMTLAEHDRRRAEEYGIAVLDGEDVGRFVDWLKDWLQR